MTWRGILRNLFVLILLAPPRAAAFAFQISESAEITQPTSGQTVSGLVTLEGTAGHLGFLRYDLSFAYAHDPTPTWFTIAEAVETQVYSGRLGIWDTTGITEGEYDVRLRVWTPAAEPLAAYVRAIRVARTLPPPSATASPEATPPTPLPTVTRRAAPVSPVAAAPTPSADSRLSAADRAFVIGAGAGATVLGGLAAYSWIRTRLRAASPHSRRRPRIPRRPGPAPR